MHTNDHSRTKIAHATWENGLLYLLTTPKPNKFVQCRLADTTKNVGIKYWIPVPAYEPVNSMSILISSKKYVSNTGGTTVTTGKIAFLKIKLYDSSLDVSRNKLCKLFLSVIAMIGKLVDSVKTGNKARKYSTISRNILSLSEGTKFSVYKSFRCAKANAPVNARSR